MPRSQIPKRETPKDEISHPIQKHNRPYTGPTGESRVQPPVEVAIQRQWDQFVGHMKNMRPSEKAQFIKEQPSALQEMCYIIVEATSGGAEKQLVLQYLAPPGKTARARYQPQVDNLEVPDAVVA